MIKKRHISESKKIIHFEAMAYKIQMAWGDVF